MVSGGATAFWGLPGIPMRKAASRLARQWSIRDFAARDEAGAERVFRSHKDVLAAVLHGDLDPKTRVVVLEP